MRFGYHKQTNSHEEAIHHLIGMKTSSFIYLLVQGSCFAMPLSLSTWLNYHQCCILTISHTGLSLQFVVSSVIYEYLSHVFTLKEWLYRLTYDTRPSLGALRRECGLGTRLVLTYIMLNVDWTSSLCTLYVHELLFISYTLVIPCESQLTTAVSGDCDGVFSV